MPDTWIHKFSFTIVSPRVFDDKLTSNNSFMLLIVTINPSKIKSVSFNKKERVLL